jgi:hypothetical protein
LKEINTSASTYILSPLGEDVCDWELSLELLGRNCISPADLANLANNAFVFDLRDQRDLREEKFGSALRLGAELGMTRDAILGIFFSRIATG